MREFHRAEAGNVIFIILIAVVLIGFLSAAILNSSNESSNIDQENLIIKAAQVRAQAGEFERGIQYILQNDVSENDFRFAHTDGAAEYGSISSVPSRQLFHSDGGGASYKSPPSGISDGSDWEFYGGTTLPAIGSDNADLVAVLPNVTAAFCAYINISQNQAAELGDAGACINSGAAGRFGDSVQYASSPNDVDEADFAQDTASSVVKPAPQGCVLCAADSQYHFYHVIYAR